MTFFSSVGSSLVGLALLVGLGCSRVAAPNAGSSEGAVQAEGAVQPTVSEGQHAPSPGSVAELPEPVAKSAAVVELFTSEGCSSCPAADSVLAALTEEAERGARRVFTLEFHVDYWNDLGWVDAFSSKEYSARQGMYARALALDGLYTPQAVVNGREQLVGSNARALKGAIERALSGEPRAGLSLAVDATNSAVHVRYRLSADAPTELGLALAQDRATTQVTRGENADRTLLHRHVVRAFATRELGATATGEHGFSWPRALPKTEAVLIAFVSDRASHAVLTAEALRVPSPSE